MISQMASFYAVPKSRKNVDNFRVVEAHFFSDDGILELKSQMKHKFVSVQDEEHFCVSCMPFSVLLLYEACQWFVVRVVLPYYYLQNRPLHSQIQHFADVFLCTVFIWWYVDREMLTLLIQVSVILRIPDYRFGLFGTVFVWFFYLRYNISCKFPNRNIFRSDWL